MIGSSPYHLKGESSCSKFEGGNAYTSMWPFLLMEIFRFPAVASVTPLPKREFMISSFKIYLFDLEKINPNFKSFKYFYMMFIIHNSFNSIWRALE